MQKIKVFALGGLDELGKNCYCIEINNQIIIFDAGLRYPDNIVFSVHSFIPNLNFFRENRDRIIAIFISHADLELCGAVPFIVQEVPNIVVYAEEYAQFVIKERIKSLKSSIQPHFENLTSGLLLKAKNFLIHAFNSPSSSPKGFIFTIKTEMGSIVYATDYLFDNSGASNNFQLTELIQHLQNKTLLFMNESMNLISTGLTSPRHLVTPLIEPLIFNHKNRIIIGLYDNNMSYVKEIFEIAKTYNRKIVLESEFLSDAVMNCLENKYLSDANLEIFYSHEDFENVQDAIVLLSRSPADIFTELTDVGAGSHPKIKLDKNDLVICLAVAFPGNELSAALAFDSLSKANAKVVPFSRKQLNIHHCSYEDLKMMLYMLKPKYFMPIRGLYKHFLLAKKAAIDTSIDEKHVLLVENGEVYICENETFHKHSEAINAEAFLVSNSNLEKIENNNLNDKLKLAENGIIICSFGINKKTKKITTNIDLQMRGVIFIKDNIHILNEINEQIVEQTNMFFDKNHNDYKFLEKNINLAINRYAQKNLKKDPVVMTIIDFNEIT